MTKYPALDGILRVIKELVSSLHVIEATELAKEAGDSIMQNVVMVGCLAGSGFTPVKIESVRKVMNMIFMEKRSVANLKAFELGVKAIRKTQPLYLENLPRV